MIEENDWRLKGDEEEYLSGKKFIKIKFPDFWEKSYRTKNAFYRLVAKEAERYVDRWHEYEEYLESEKIQSFWHDHCVFCWEKFMTDMDIKGYCSQDYRTWICKTCFEDFKEKFHLSLTVDV